MNYLIDHDDAIRNLEPAFGDLPADPYTEGNFRFRRYSAFRYKGGVLDILPPETFTQSRRINAYLGDVQRTYDPIDEATWRDPAFRRMLEHFDEHTLVDIGKHIGVHQIRIRKTGDAVMAPEGRHQDGFDRIAVYVVGRENLDGGNLRLSANARDEPFIEAALMPGDYVVINDRALFHNASPIERIDEDRDAFIDFFVATSMDDGKDRLVQ
ncbi:MAG: 2OG-Fe dioxygenase family protein [Rhodospirillales bacterium]